MTRPIHTVKYMQANYRKYQFLAISCALLTVTAAMLAAFSGMRSNMLRNALASAETNASHAQAAETAKELEKTQLTLTQVQAQLNAEREQMALLRKKIDELERRLAAEQETPRSNMQMPATRMPSIPYPEPPPVHATPAGQVGSEPAITPETAPSGQAPTPRTKLTEPQVLTQPPPVAEPAHESAPPVSGPAKQTDPMPVTAPSSEDSQASSATSDIEQTEPAASKTDESGTPAMLSVPAPVPQADQTADPTINQTSTPQSN